MRRDVPAFPGAPPPPPVAEAAHPPRAGCVWVAGRHAWRAGDYVWTAGHWERQKAGLTWWEIPRPTQLLIQFVYGTGEESKKLFEALRKPFEGRLDDTASLMAGLDTGEGAVALRQALRLNQSAFWAAVSVTQSGGSRYETQRKMPRAVPTLLRLVFGPEVVAQQLFDALRSYGLKPLTNGQKQRR